MDNLKNYKKTMILTSIVILLPTLIGVVLWEQLPDQVATHFSFDGTPNGWSGKGFTVFGIPLFLLACQWGCAVITFRDPKRQNMSEKLFKLILWIIPAAAMMVAIVCYGYALGYETSHGTLEMAFLGVLFIIVGNYLPKCRQNYTLGIKLPWTLHDEENWNHTHRMAGYLWILGGFLMLVNILLKWDWLIGAVIAVAGGVPTVYSYLYYEKHGEKKEN